MKKAFFILLISIVLVSFYGIYTFKEEEKVYPNNELIKVNITGAVNFPGEYNVSPQTTFFMLVNYAGGFKKDADLSNLKEDIILEDNKSYHIFYMKKDDDESFLININKATEVELMKLPGIGSAKALAIINHRNRHGPFLNKEDIKNVTGIGSKIYEELQDKITV